MTFSGLNRDASPWPQSPDAARRTDGARHHPAGEFVDQHNFTVADDVILVLGEQLVGAQTLIDVVHDGGAFGIIEALPFRQRCRTRQVFFQKLVALVGEGYVAGFLVQLKCSSVRSGITLSMVMYSSTRSCAGPEIISGVRASSIRMLSTSSTIAKVVRVEHVASDSISCCRADSRKPSSLFVA